jgi:hypothetical protein
LCKSPLSARAKPVMGRWGPTLPSDLPSLRAPGDRLESTGRSYTASSLRVLTT